MKLRINENETPNIEVKHEGILEVPEGKKVDELPYSHFEKLAKKKGLSKITKALNNLQVWNKNDDPKLSKWAGNMIDKLNKKLKKDESVSVKENIDNEPRIIGFIVEYPDKSYSLNAVDLSDLDERKISEILYNYLDNGVSVRGDKDISLSDVL